MAKTKWIDPTGQEIPAQYVPKLDKMRDRTARRILKKAEDLSKRLAAFKEEAITAADAVYDAMMAENKIRKNSRGGYTITSFDKSVKIEISIQERIEFDDLIQVAQEKINEFLAEKTGGVDEDLRQIINLAFKTSKGQMDVKRVLSLFKLNIHHKKWLEAMEILKKSISRNITKRYMRVWKKDAAGEYKAVELNFSAL
jgi:hypothetical protein